MSGTPERTVSEPEKIVFDGAVDTLNVRIVGGAVNVVGIEEGPARMEVTELDGPPLKVKVSGSTLTVAYEDLTWKGLLKWRERGGWKRHAVISLAVPQRTRVEVGVIGAEAVVSGITGPTSVQGVNGDTTLVGLTGPVTAKTVAGNVEAQSLSGDLRINTVSGDLTVVEGSGSEVRADSVSGNMVLDLDPSAGAHVRLTTVSGEIAIRIPEPGDADVDASTTSGHVSCAFEELHVSGWGDGSWAAKRITGRIGSGAARLRATTVSGAIALLRRPPFEDTADSTDTADVTGASDAADTADPAADGPWSPFRKES
jgi:Putative adhesin